MADQKDGRRKTAPHGTRARYYHATDPCRCAACREANAAYQRRQRHPPPIHPAGTVMDKRGKVVGHQGDLFG